MYGTPRHGKTASTTLVFGMIHMMGHNIRIIESPQQKDLT